MEIPRPIANLIDHANQVNQGKSERLFQIDAVLITPVTQIELLVPTGFARMCDFGSNFSDDMTIAGNMQPGVYQQDVLPYKDNLFMEVVKRVGYQQVKYRYRATPLGDTNIGMEGGNTALANLKTKDAVNMVTVKFQLLEVGYSLLKTEQVSDIMGMTRLFDVLHGQLTKYGELMGTTDADAWRGVDIEEPVDNDRIFQQVVIPSAVPLIELGRWIQNHAEFGFYSTGLGMYFRKGMWYIYPLFRLGRYDTARKVLDVYRIPSNIMPTVKNSYFVNGKTVTILATGGAEHQDDTDIDRQNQGTGKRLISSDAVMNETGRYYGKGQALTTRQDSLSEYQTAKRASGEEIIPFHKIPGNNVCKFLSLNAYNDVTTLNVNWHNSDCTLIEPGMPVRYFYIGPNDTLLYREGTVGSIRGEDQKDTENIPMVFREHSALQLFLNSDILDGSTVSQS